MKFLDACKTLFARIAPFLGFSPGLDRGFDVQHPLTAEPLTFHPDPVGAYYKHPPKFHAPQGPEGPDNFTCVYPNLGRDWKSCSTPTNRGCWLKKNTGEEFNITTDYEAIWPKGIVRNYTLIVSNTTLTLDGVSKPYSQVFNNTYPGPWIQACWGDVLNITVINNLTTNGTSIHWHGLRQLGSFNMDGVNGVTQCPIPPPIKHKITSDNIMTYTFNTTQYGTSWYHSHYSLQYADGLAGPLTIYGPASANYDEGRDPFLIADWTHGSAFQLFQQEIDLNSTGPPGMDSILLNGQGNYNFTQSTSLYSTSVTRGKKYLLRLINTSVDSGYIVKIDNHILEVLTTDFVPIHPYNTTNITIGIGQRYHVVLHATPLRSNPDGNYWIRTIPATPCSGLPVDIDDRVGILRYNAASTKNPPGIKTSLLPSERWCRDEPYHLLRPIVPWTIDLPFKDNQSLRADMTTDFPHPKDTDVFSRWKLGDRPLWLNFSDPIITNLKQPNWNPDWVVIPENYKDGWVTITISTGQTGDPDFIPAAHPIHLHGHDFALLAQGTWAAQPNPVLKLDNPPRRDVVLLPQDGYAVIAFRADNPGSWLIHCHIAWHASSGLAVQILEAQQSAAALITPDKLSKIQKNCDAWNTWYNNTSHWWDPAEFQDDSGI